MSTRSENLRGASMRQSDAVARDAGVDIQVGLSDAEAARRLLSDGANELAAKAGVPRWRRLLEQFHDP